MRTVAMMLLSLVAVAPAHAKSNEEDTRRFWAGWQLPSADGLYERWDPRRSWGASHLIDALQQVSRRVAFELPHADPLMIGDISRRGGGRLLGHVTHDRGIDADVGLFMHDGRQPLGGFLDLRPHQLDIHANWVLIASLLDTGCVQHILLDQGHINALRAYAAGTVGLDQPTIDSIFPPEGTRIHWREAGVIRHAPNHRSHLHVRLIPPLGDADNGAPVPASDAQSPAPGPRNPKI